MKIGPTDEYVSFNVSLRDQNIIWKTKYLSVEALHSIRSLQQTPQVQQKIGHFLSHFGGLFSLMGPLTEINQQKICEVVTRYQTLLSDIMTPRCTFAHFNAHRAALQNVRGLLKISWSLL